MASLEFWVQYLTPGGEYSNIRSSGLSNDLYWEGRRTTDSTTYRWVPGKPEKFVIKNQRGWGPANGPEKGLENGIDYYVYVHPDVDRVRMRGYQFAQVYIAPAGLNLDIDKLPWWNNGLAQGMAIGPRPPAWVV